MGIKCHVFIDHDQTGEPYTFPAVPRTGDDIQIEQQGNPRRLRVDGVLFVAQGTYENMSDGDVQIHASTREES